MGTVLFKFIVGAIAGIVAWMIFAPFAPKSHAEYLASNWENGYVVGLGAIIGLAVGAFDGFTRGGKLHTIRGAVLGLALGAVGMSFGHGLFGALVNSIFQGLAFKGNIAVDMPARTLAFAGMGLCLGAGIGAASLNVKKILQGAIGGAIGGAIAGALFDPISAAIANATVTLQGGNEVGGPGRAIMALLLGAAIALFIGIVDRLSRSAWLRLSLGRNEGKEWVIDTQNTFIGRKEGVHVPLFGDDNVAPIHASIRKQGGQYILVDGGSPAGTLLNGQFVQQAPLFHGAQIQIGSFVLQFLMKNQAAPARGPEPYMGQAYPMQPQPVPQPHLQPQPQPQATAAWQPIPTQAMPQAASMPTMAVTPAAPAQGPSLIAIDGPLMGQRFAVTQPSDVGRECPFIPMSFDVAASRRHASVSPAARGVSVEDRGSTNGTFVNGQRVAHAMAGPGDLVKIGSTTFRVEA